MGKRTWIKVYTDNWIQGSIREEAPEVRCTWIDLLALVGASQYSDIGELKLIGNSGYTDNQISEILSIDKDLWLTAKQRFIDTDRITIHGSNIIIIKNWKKYQSEYSRVKKSKENSTAF